MNIVVIGAGKFGKALIHMLSKENHNITVIDNNKALIKDITDEYNVIGYFGNGASYNTLKEVGANNADLLVACTGNDEINILACAISKTLKIKNSIARIRNRDYDDQVDVMSKEFGITSFVNSYQDTAKEMFKTICFPGAIKVESFAKGRVDIVEVKIDDDSELIGNTIKDIKHKYQIQSLVCAVRREEDVFIPNGDFVLEAQDYIYISGTPKVLVKTCKALKLYKNKLSKVIIVGAGETSSHLTELLSDVGIDVTVIERDKDVALEFSNNNPDAIVINADGTNIQLLEDEGLKQSVLVTLTGIDETNIVVSTLALKEGAPSVITKVSNSNLESLFDVVGLDSVFSPKEVFASKVLSYIRTIENDKPSLCKSLYRLVNDKVEALEFECIGDTKYTNTPIKDLMIKKGYLIASIIRNSKVIIPTGEDDIEVNDHIIIITTHEGTKDLSEIFE